MPALTFPNIPDIEDLKSAFQDKLWSIIHASPFYDYILGQSKSCRFIIELNDPVMGDSGRGRWLCNNVLDYKGVLQKFDDHIWADKTLSGEHLLYAHRFEWLKDLKALGGDSGRLKAREIIKEWINKYSRWHMQAWSDDVIGRRISNWIRFYPFFGASADELFQDRFFHALMKQFKHLSARMNEVSPNVKGLYTLEALIYGGLSLEGQEQTLEKALSLFEYTIENIILNDGGISTRTPEDLVCALQILLDIKLALKTAEYPVPPTIEHALDRIVPALRFFRHGDKKLALFNGGQEGNDAQIDLLIKRAGVRGKVWHSLPQTGYERISQGKSVLIYDTGNTKAVKDSSKLHASPLSFEFSCGKDRIFVNCGIHPTNAEWQNALRGTSAHNGLCVDHRNAFEIRKNGTIGRAAMHCEVKREENDDGCLIEADHDGYMTLNGLVHKRSLFMKDKGEGLYGQDVLSRQIETGQAHDFAVRFHLHPNIKLSLVREGNEVLLKSKSGAGWRFFAKDTDLHIEDSIYMGQGGDLRKTSQIVLSGLIGSEEKDRRIEWVLQKTG